MNIYVFSDESGVFDYIHNRYFVYGGLILPGLEIKEVLCRKYSAVERIIRQSNNFSRDYEIKAVSIANKYKNKIMHLLNGYYKFGCTVDENRVNANIWKSRKDKQRYLDFVYKIAVKRAFVDLINNGVIIPNEVERVIFSVDEHTTATNGRYELAQSLEQEFKYGTYSWDYSSFFPPIFPKVKEVCVKFCDSSIPNKSLIRASDIIANKIYHLSVREDWQKISDIRNLHWIKQP